MQKKVFEKLFANNKEECVANAKLASWIFVFTFKILALNSNFNSEIDMLHKMFLNNKVVED